MSWLPSWLRRGNDLFSGILKSGDEDLTRRSSVSSPQQSPWPGTRDGSAILFLDIDGVLHRGENGSFECAPVLEDLLSQLPLVDVVISSNWRIRASRQWLLEQFPEALRPRICDVTPDLSDTSCAHLRQRECEAYLAGRARSTAFIALDDDPTGFEPGCEWLLLTDRYIGLNAAVAGELKARLLG